MWQKEGDVRVSKVLTTNMFKAIFFMTVYFKMLNVK